MAAVKMTDSGDIPKCSKRRTKHGRHHGGHEGGDFPQRPAGTAIDVGQHAGDAAQSGGQDRGGAGTP